MDIFAREIYVKYTWHVAERILAITSNIIVQICMMQFYLMGSMVACVAYCPKSVAQHAQRVLDQKGVED